jgi:hypothetical protein
MSRAIRGQNRYIVYYRNVKIFFSGRWRPVGRYRVAFYGELWSVFIVAFCGKLWSVVIATLLEFRRFWSFWNFLYLRVRNEFEYILGSILGRMFLSFFYMEKFKRFEKNYLLFFDRSMWAENKRIIKINFIFY